MAGEDEARAHDVLAEMQMRISLGPESALGLGDAFSPEDVRAAFLALTKQFHPARFGRLSPELRAMSNEVFLGIKSAHDQLLRILGVATKPTGSARATGGIPPLNADTTSRMAVPSPRSTGSIPRPVTGTAPPMTQLARGTDRSSSTRAAPPAGSHRTSTPATGIPVSSAGQSGSVPRPSESQAMPRVSISSGRGPVLPTPNAPPTRQPTPPPGQTSPLARPPTLPPGQTSPIARQGTPPPGQTSPIARQGTPPPGQTSPIARQGTPPPGQTSPLAPQPARPGTLQPGQTSPLARQGTPAPGQTSPLAPPGTRPPTMPPGQTSPLARQGTPAPGTRSPLAPPGTRPPTMPPGQTSPLARQGTPAPGTRSPLAPPPPSDFNPATQRGFQSGVVPTTRAPQSPPASSATNFNVATQRGLAPAQPTQPLQRAGANVFDETSALHESLMFLEQRNWTAARQALHALAAKIPQSKQYRALLCYARGREAHAAGRGEDALLEYQRALQLDPDLVQVKQAVAELQRRR